MQRWGGVVDISQVSEFRDLSGGQIEIRDEPKLTFYTYTRTYRSRRNPALLQQNLHPFLTFSHLLSLSLSLQFSPHINRILPDKIPVLSTLSLSLYRHKVYRYKPITHRSSLSLSYGLIHLFEKDLERDIHKGRRIANGFNST